MNFHVESGGQIYKIQRKQGLIQKSLDPEGNFKTIFTWEDHFEPQSLKDVHVSYDVPMSFNSMETGRKLGTLGVQFFFPYITKTAYTWKQPVENAHFQFDLTTLVSQIKSSLDKDLKEGKLFLVDASTAKELNIYQGKPLIYLQESISASGGLTYPLITLGYYDKLPEDGIFLGFTWFTSLQMRKIWMRISRKCLSSMNLQINPL
jgi:hypothetical protein